MLVDFENEARNDALKLCHWQKEKEIPDVYPFAKLNKKPEIINYSDEEYKEHLEVRVLLGVLWF